MDFSVLYSCLYIFDGVVLPNWPGKVGPLSGFVCHVLSVQIIQLELWIAEISPGFGAFCVTTNYSLLSLHMNEQNQTRESFFLFFSFVRVSGFFVFC